MAGGAFVRELMITAEPDDVLLPRHRLRRDFKFRAARRRTSARPRPRRRGANASARRGRAGNRSRWRRRGRRSTLRPSRNVSRIMPALRMRLEVKQPDYVRGGEFLCRQGQLSLGIAVIPDCRKRLVRNRYARRRGYDFGLLASLGPGMTFQKRFSRARISANTFQAGLPASPTDCATSGTSARRNGFAAFSAPMVAGIVGFPVARSRSTSSARAASAVLLGSMVLAKRILAAVYSWPQ